MTSAARRIAPWALGPFVLLLLAAAAQAQTIKKAPAPRLTSIEGVDTFRSYCAVCHGPQGKGNGPAAPALKTVPADLTTITKRRGRFSAADMEEWITGKRLTPAHGDREMPI